MSQTGIVIREMRKNAGYTQKSLAEVLNVTDKAVSKWERGLCLPDVTLLPKLALILDVDIDLLVSKEIQEEKWSGLIEIYGCDFSKIVYDKPLIYYLLSHFLILGIKNIYFLTDEENKSYLKNNIFKRLGFDFYFEVPKALNNVIVIKKPLFLFGSDLTQQFKGAMLTENSIKLVPFNQNPVAYVLKSVNEQETEFARNLGRGMLSIDMSNEKSLFDVVSFVRIYQENSGLIISSLEEIAYRSGLINSKQFEDLIDNVPYKEKLRRLISKPQVD